MLSASRPAERAEPETARASTLDYRGAALCGLVFVTVFGVYWVTLAPGVLGGDAGELQFVPPILSLTHPTGYPLQVLLHKGWSLLPLGSVAYRLNVLDAAIAAGAIALVAACGWAVCGRWLPALLGAATFAFSELWWSQAVAGDKYTLNGLFVALVLFLFMRWRSTRGTAWLGALAFSYGLSLTHHRSMLLLAPPLAAGLLLEGWRPRGWRQAVTLLALAVMPLLLYLYVPWAASRGLPPGAWRVDTPGAFLEYLLDRGYVSQIQPGTALAGRLAEEGSVLLRSFGPLGVVLGIVGAAWLLRRELRLAVVLVLAFGAHAVLGASYLLESHYALPRHWVFYLPAFLIWSLWTAAGLAAILRWIEQAAWPRRAWGMAALVAVFLALQGTTVWARSAEAMVRAQIGAETLDGYRQDLQRSPPAERFGRLAFEVAEPGAIIVCDWEQATVLWYLQQVEGYRADVDIRYPIETLEQSLAVARQGSRPVYVARTLQDLAAWGVPSSIGPLLRVLPSPDGTLPASAAPVGSRLEGGLSVAGVTYHGTSFRAGGVLPLTLWWRAEQPLDQDYSVSVRLLSSDRQVVAQHDESHPALGTSPTSRWRPGDVIGDYHELPLGNRLPPGAYHVEAIMYRRDSMAALRQLDGSRLPQNEAVALPSFGLSARQPGPYDLLLRPFGRA